MATPQKKWFASVLWANATPHERKMKAYLDTKPLGFSWIFQKPYIGYIPDFRCVVAKTIIEIDGFYHTINADYDARRDTHMWRRGHQTIRFTNDEIDTQFPSVCDRVLQALSYFQATKEFGKEWE